MSCNCIEKIEEDTQLRHNAAAAFVEHFGRHSQVSYRPYTAAGEVSKHNRYTHIDWVYCPFCGRKIERSEAGV